MPKIIATANGASTARRATERKRAAPKAEGVDVKENVSIEKKNVSPSSRRENALKQIPNNLTPKFN